jgi:hypothetical protein
MKNLREPNEKGNSKKGLGDEQQAGNSFVARVSSWLVGMGAVH